MNFHVVIPLIISSNNYYINVIEMFIGYLQKAMHNA